VRWYHRAFVRAEISVFRESSIVRFLQPSRNDGNVYDWDDGADDYVFVREMTAEEKREADAADEQAYAKWKETGGKARTLGAICTRGRFFTASGGYADAWLEGGVWHWAGWNFEEIRR